MAFSLARPNSTVVHCVWNLGQTTQHKGTGSWNLAKNQNKQNTCLKQSRWCEICHWTPCDKTGGNQEYLQKSDASHPTTDYTWKNKLPDHQNEVWRHGNYMNERKENPAVPMSLWKSVVFWSFYCAKSDTFQQTSTDKQEPFSLEQTQHQKELCVIVPFHTQNLRKAIDEWMNKEIKSVEVLTERFVNICP